jgi:trimethylamine--corrinoid protein Co-methyltransferase
MGLLRGSTLLVPEALVLDAELYSSAQENAAKLETCPDYLAIDVIQKVGPRGHYLRERHTREYFRKLRFSEILHVPADSGTYRDPIETAREKTDWILKNHEPEPLSEYQQAELTRIVAAAEKELSRED